jgi:hypothetical protein
MVGFMTNLLSARVFFVVLVQGVGQNIAYLEFFYRLLLKYLVFV